MKKIEKNQADQLLYCFTLNHSETNSKQKPCEHSESAGKKKKKRKKKGRRWSVLHSLFRNKVHLGNRCCCCNTPGTTGCSLAPSPKCVQGESGPGAAAAGAAPKAGTCCLSNKNLSVQLRSQTGRAATVLDQLFLCTLHPSHL